MDKTELSRYYWLKHEIKSQKRRLDIIQRRMAREDKTVGDTVKDYRSGKGIPVLIQGIPEDDFTDPVLEKVLSNELAANIRQLDEEAVKVEQFIQSVDDPQMRELLRSRFIDCKRWFEVGNDNHLSQDHARKKIREFFKEQEKNNKVDHS